MLPLLFWSSNFELLECGRRVPSDFIFSSPPIAFSNFNPFLVIHVLLGRALLVIDFSFFGVVWSTGMMQEGFIGFDSAVHPLSLSIAQQNYWQVWVVNLFCTQRGFKLMPRAKLSVVILEGFKVISIRDSEGRQFRMDLTQTPPFRWCAGWSGHRRMIIHQCCCLVPRGRRVIVLVIFGVNIPSRFWCSWMRSFWLVQLF